MFIKTFLTIILILFLSALSLWTDVRPGITHQPEVPFFLQSMNFRPMQLQIFPQQVAGMVKDPFADLIWNPAFITDQDKTVIYLDLNAQTHPPASQPNFLNRNQFYNSYLLNYNPPRYYGTSTYSRLDNSPLYNFAAIFSISKKLKLGVVNRTILDQGSFRDFTVHSPSSFLSQSGYTYYYYNEMLNYSPPERESWAKNQQDILGNQVEVFLGYSLSERLQLGIRFGHLTFSRNGRLFNSDKGIFTWTRHERLDKNSLDTSAHHIEAGLGIVFKVGDSTQIALYGGVTTGSGDESLTGQDDFYRLYEDITDNKYFEQYQDFKKCVEKSSFEGNKPTLTLTFIHEFSRSLSLRSLLSCSWSETTTTGTTDGDKQFLDDYGYDTYVSYNTYAYRKRKETIDASFHLTGEETRKTSSWQWFASLTFAPNQSWNLFGGIYLQGSKFTQAVEENASSLRNRHIAYTLYNPTTYRYYDSFDSTYRLDGEITQWMLFLPLGLKARIIKQVDLILGADLNLTLLEKAMTGSLVYNSRIHRYWYNEKLSSQSVEKDRVEDFSETSPRELTKRIGHNFGLIYHIGKHVDIYLRSHGEIFRTSNWALGMLILL